jgi:hypothetical protein
MEKLIFEHNWSIPYESNGTEVFAVEYESKIAFQCYVFDLIKKSKNTDDTFVLFGWSFYDLSELEIEIEHNVYTIEEWFEKKKQKL